MSEPKTKYDNVVDYCKNHPVIYPVILIVAIMSGISSIIPILKLFHGNNDASQHIVEDNYNARIDDANYHEKFWNYIEGKLEN
jgi:hypothetical protein